MEPTFTLTSKIIRFIRLSIPIIITQFSLMAGAFISILLTGQYSTVHLAGISVGYNIWISMFYGTMGVLLGISPILGQLLGAKKKDTIPAIVGNGLYLATVLGLGLVALGIIGLKPVLSLLDLEPAAYDISIKYMSFIGVAIVPLMWSCILRNTVDSHGYTHYSMTVIFTSFLLNVFLNYGLILGHFGFPAMGGVGAGIATAICSWYNVLAYTVILTNAKAFKGYQFFKNLGRPIRVYILDQIKLGVPIGFAIFCEMSIFSLAALLMAYYGTNIIAAHQAAISFTNLFYGFPLSISIACTIAVSYEVGAKRYKDARTYAYIARIMAIMIAMLICSYTFTHLREISGYYTTDPSMIQLIGSFLSYAVFFSVIDAFGTPLQGVLRGYKDVKIVSAIAISCYWGVSIPVVALFTYVFNYGPYGIWVGLLSSVAAAGVLYTWRTWYIQYRRYKI
ncbi:MATE family efflux transporter [uncultured Veillonella sp.]|uniref:MATE family efflux transporter n=1 Tax=uncultured Veillonella sp. TaxID=159268 RepID=UPI0025F6EB02|nr:MATE family efflux transporter [uncultured Veillonella sp.]MDY3973248.1 MATE family efflux transporter [Veillonella caviae]